MQLIRDLKSIQHLQYPLDASVAFVPTMGFLHDGHLSLVQKAKAEHDICVVSIFVNPAQFGPKEDLASYPRDLERDLALLKDLAVDYVFFPTPELMYPAGYRTWVTVEELSSVFCGATRAGHFRGVCTIVLKLINLVRPHEMYMGEKDFQQITILRKMVQELNLSVKIIGCPIVREVDGLAKSSRNIYLNPAERIQALSLSHALLQAQKMARAGSFSPFEIISASRKILQDSGAIEDYVSIVDARDLHQQDALDVFSRMLIAAYVGQTRLIDNMPLA